MQPERIVTARPRMTVTTYDPSPQVNASTTGTEIIATLCSTDPSLADRRRARDVSQFELGYFGCAVVRKYGL
jgi:hypothetical protein